MTKLHILKQKLKNIFTFLPKIYPKLSISTQLLVTFILIFISFFVLQTMLNSAFFKGYYTESEFQRINTDLLTFVDKMNEDDVDFYDEMYSFTSENNAYSVITNGQYRVLQSSTTNYTVTIEDSTTHSDYTFLVPNTKYEYTNGETLSIDIFTYNNELYTPATIDNIYGELYSADFTCSEEDCITITGLVTTISKPNNLNYFFEDNILIANELKNLRTGIILLDDHEYETGTVTGYWYKSIEGPVDTIVFVHYLNDWNRIITVVPIVDTNEVVNIISNYNYYAYVTAIVIILIWSLRITTTYSKPIQNIEEVAREIAQLNFDEEVHEYSNKENKSLSNSINLISRNLKETLETINTKNEELTKLYVDQSNQVSLKKQLVSSISHELKTPLMIMQVTIQAILDGIIEPKDEEKELNNVLLEISKSSVMIQDMLQIYRLDDANRKLELTTFDLSETVKFFIDDFENAINKFEFDIDVNIQDEVYIKADHKLIKRVISNFITNAIKYTPSKEHMYIEVSETSAFVYFELTNYGVSISDSEIEKIWLPFYRIDNIDTNRVQSKGSGIGLYLVKEILNAHDAEFGITNTKNGITAFFKLYKKMS